MNDLLYLVRSPRPGHSELLIHEKGQPSTEAAVHALTDEQALSLWRDLTPIVQRSAGRGLDKLRAAQAGSELRPERLEASSGPERGAPREMGRVRVETR